MKKLLFILAILALLPFDAKAETVLNDAQSFSIAKAVKLGRSKSSSAYSSSTTGNKGGSTELLKQCVTECSSCDMQTGTCSSCKPGYYLDRNICVSCPSNGTCSNGRTFTCNNYYFKSGDECTAICSQTTCASGTSKTSQADRCCCI